MTQNVRDAALARRGEGDGQQLSPVDQMKADLRQNRGWFKTVVPRHIDADQFVALCLGVVSKGGDQLVQALIDAPHTFLQAASECARMGLVPGETYWFVPFKSRKQVDGRWVTVYEVTGIVDYKGEMDMIYRAGGVSSIHCHVVRANDTFRWRPGQMDVPLHIIGAPDDSGQEGLASFEERGHITGVYAFCKMADGGYSQPTVMGLSEIKRHRSFAKTDAFWGPVEGLYDVEKEGKHTVDMVRKTAVHKQFDMVPHSAEYVRERMRVDAEIERRGIPVTAAAIPLAISAGPEISPPGADDEAAPSTSPPGDDPGEAVSAPPPADPERRRRANSKLHALFRTHQMGAKDQSDSRRAVVAGLLQLEALPDIAQLTDDELERAGQLLEDNVNLAAARDGDVAAELAQFASNTAKRIMQQQGA